MDTKNVQEYIRIKAVYTGADAANYEMTIVEVEVQRSQCRHNLDKVTAAAATEFRKAIRNTTSVKSVVNFLKMHRECLKLPKKVR